MRLRSLFSLLALLLLVPAAAQVWNTRAGDIAPPQPEALRIVTQNTHYILLDATGDDPWSVAGWQRRRDAMAQTLSSLQPDLIAFQEMESFRHGNDGSVNLARDDLLTALPGFAAGASGDWRSFPSTQPIFYRRARLRLLDQGWFFFSDTPDVIYSRTFNGSYPAFASWGQFRDLRTGRTLRLVNVHFDYRSHGNRQRSAELVAQRIAPWIAAGEAVVLAGDLNAFAGSRIVGTLERAGLSLTPARGSSFHFNRGINLLGAIDHVMHDCSIALTGRPVAVRARPGGQWPSDHYPVLAQIRLGAGDCPQP